MKFISLNVKGLTDPAKVKKAKAWLKSQRKVDDVILTEIKVSGQDLEQRL